jgi:hypothetical protein
MRPIIPSWITCLFVVLLALCIGCPGPGDEPNGGPETPNGDPAAPPETPGNGNPATPTGNGNDQPGTPENGNPEEPAEATIPEVQLPEMLAATCLVGVGDKMPDAPMDVLGGEQAALRSQFGPRLTVMLFWTSSNLYACDELADLTGDVAEPYEGDGVRVIGINVGDSAEDAAKAVAEAGPGFPNFLDPKGEYFAKVATERLPRTYLLSPDGTILWFDLEYSPTTRRQLTRAIDAVLGGAEASPAVEPTEPETPASEGETPESVEEPPADPSNDSETPG